MTTFDFGTEGWRRVSQEVLRIEGAEPTPLVAADPARLCVEVAGGAATQLVVVHRKAGECRVECRLDEGARLELVHLFLADAAADVAVTQAAGSRCRTTSVLLAGGRASYRMRLEGVGAESELGGVFFAAGEERAELDLRTEHLVADCRSDSRVKGIAADDAVCRFGGMVYVAPDAQRTDAQQQSRNILLSDTARIVTRPQLEIYADDVKCSHGATVGQMDSEAILYMRQRGLSEMQARRLQIEGFVGDVVRRCGLEPLCDAVMERVAAKMEQIR